MQNYQDTQCKFLWIENNKKGIQLGKDNPYMERDILIEKIYEKYIKPKRIKK